MTRWNDLNLSLKNRSGIEGGSASIIVRRSKRGIPFIPGLALVLLGATIILAPRLIFYALGVLLLFLGLLFWGIAWKVMQLRQKFIAIQRNLDGRVEIHQMRMRQSPVDIEEDPDVKITFH